MPTRMPPPHTHMLTKYLRTIRLLFASLFFRNIYLFAISEQFQTAIIRGEEKKEKEEREREKERWRERSGGERRKGKEAHVLRV